MAINAAVELPTSDGTTPPTSPFLPGTKIQFAWDSTSLGYLKTCPRLYQYQMIEGWQSHDESAHLRFGIEYHRALQEYDIHRASGVSHDQSIRNSVQALLQRTWDWRPEHKYKNRDYLLRSVIWYLDKYEHDPATTVILDDGKPAVELSFRFELDWGPQADQPYLLCGHLDRVVNFQGDLYVMDHKTTTSTPGDYYFDQFTPNNQMTLYTFASQVILSSPIRGVIIDVVQIAIGFSRFTRGFTYRTPQQIVEWLGDLTYWFGLAEQYAANGYWPQNDTACDKFGGCRFREICSKSPQVRGRFLRANFTQAPEDDRWNPLRSR